MKALLAGGGRFDLKHEQLPLLEQAIAWAGDQPRLLIIPTPLKWPPFDELDELIRLLTIKSRHSSVQFETLTPNAQDLPNYDRAAKLIKWANIILVPGGNVTEQLERWRTSGIGRLLVQAAQTDTTIFIGGSTGLMCWFQGVHTNCRLLGATGPSHGNYHLEQGLGILPGVACAHYEGFNMGTGEPRAASFRSMMRHQPIGAIGIGVTTHAALQIDGDAVKIIGQDRYATVHRLMSTHAGLATTIYRAGDGIVIPLKDFFAN